MERYYSYSRFLREYFGEKLYKICLNGGFTCPNRDGTLASGGCIFCSAGGSGDFAEDAALPIREQLRRGRAQTAGKYHGDRYIAYFQAFTNTYAPLSRLTALYEEAISAPEVAALAIGTRPDCLPPEVIALLAKLNKKKPVFVEMGLQTSHDDTARFLNRAYETAVFTKACQALHQAGLRASAHVILGLPGEDAERELATISYLNALPISGVKLSMLYVLKGTHLADYYAKEPFPLLTMEEYVDRLLACLGALRPDIVVERMTGDAPPDLLVAPEWLPKKHAVLNRIHHLMKERNFMQGENLWKNH